MTTIQSYFQQIAAPKNASTICAIFFGILSCLMLISCFSTWISDWQAAHAAPTSAYVSTKNETTEMLAALPESHLFGQNLSSDTPITDLHAKVTGIVSIGDEKEHKNSKAYISISEQPSKIFKPGDELTDGVTVYDITSDTVILENDGHLEKLPLPRESLMFKPREKEPE